MQAISLRAPAKINLYLRVFPAAPDGYHPLRSWFRTIELLDELSIQEIRRAVTEPPRPELVCDDPSVPVDNDNLILKASQLLNHGEQRNSDVRVTLQKRIPMGAGLGGGSSDGAAMLAAENHIRRSLGREPYPRELLLKVALAMGADVPFFLHHQLDGITDATCTGRGEIVHPFVTGRRHIVLLILPDLPLATADVYRRFDELPTPPDDDSPNFASWSQLPAVDLLPRLRNDLEAAAFSLHPELARVRDRMEDVLARPVRMSGSGSALFTLYDEPSRAAEALDHVRSLSIRSVIA